MSLQDKITALQEKAAQLEEAKKMSMDSEEDDSEGDGEEIEDEDETKSGKKDQIAERADREDDEHGGGPTPSQNPDKGWKPKKGVKKVMQEDKIDLGALFDGVDLTEEFKTKAVTIFEAAVAARVAQVTESLEEELAQRALTESEELKEGLVEKVDGYLDYIVEQWIANNEIALERGIKAEIFESFVTKMRDVFVEHNINLPDEEFDLVESLQEKAETLESKLDEAVAQNVELSKTIKEAAKTIKIKQFCEGMTDIDAEKFSLLAEEISFDDEESFAKKLETIRENYVSKKEVKETKQLTEDVTQDANTPVITEDVKVIDATMARYLKAL